MPDASLSSLFQYFVDFNCRLWSNGFSDPCFKAYPGMFFLIPLIISKDVQLNEQVCQWPCFHRLPHQTKWLLWAQIKEINPNLILTNDFKVTNLHINYCEITLMFFSVLFSFHSYPSVGALPYQGHLISWPGRSIAVTPP